MLNLSSYQNLIIRQVHEVGEWVGFETRNKYEILDSSNKQVAYAAEQSKGVLGFLLRQYLGHWRSFDVHIFSPDRELVLVANHPFRWFFSRIEIRDKNGKYLGAIQKRFSILTKKFKIESARGRSVMEVASPIWKLWTFLFMSHGRQQAAVKKKWSGLLSEVFTDKDNFMIEYNRSDLDNEKRILILASSIFIDLLYFERKR